MDTRRREFEERVLPLQNDLVFAAAAMTGREADAQDLVQETLLKAWRNFESFNRGDNLKAWLFTILRNSYLDRCRRRRLEPVALDPAVEESPGGAAAGAGRIEEALPEDLLEALRSLKPAHRIAVLLADVEGLSYRQIADVLGCPLGSVMSGLYHARLKLREKLAARS